MRALGFVVVPWIEAFIALSLVTGREPLGAGLAVVLLSVFSVAIVRARLRQGTNRLRCGCFGGTASRDFRLLLLRNVALAAVALAVLLWFEPDTTGDLLLASFDLFPVGLVVFGILASLWTARRAGLYARELRDA